MNIAVLHPQCRVRGGAIKMALLSAQSLRKQGHHVIFYTFDHDPECFPELQDGLTIVTAKTTKTMNNEQGIMNNAGSEKTQMNNDQGIMKNDGGSSVIPAQAGIHPEKESAGSAVDKTKPKLDTVDKSFSFWGLLSKLSPRFFAMVGIAWDIRQVDIVIAHNPPMQIVGALAKFFSFFSSYHQQLAVIWWHHHIPWYYIPKKKAMNNKKTVDILLSLTSFFSAKGWKGFLERHYILPRVKYLIATSYYTAFCIEKYCRRKAIVMHPVIMNNEQGTMNNEVTATNSPLEGGGGTIGKKSGVSITDGGTPPNPLASKGESGTRPVTLFTHGRLEPGKGLDTLVKVWKELKQVKNEQGIMNNEGSEKAQMNNEQGTMNNAGIKLVIAGEGSLKSWLIEQGATVIPYYEGLLTDIQMNNEKGIMNNEGSEKAQMNNEQGTMNNAGSEKAQMNNDQGIMNNAGMVGLNSKFPPEMTNSDILAIYLSTIDAFGMAPLEAQIAGLSVIILDKGGARETVLLDNNKAPMAQLIDTENEILPAITYFIQQRTLHKRVSNVNFCHQREYFNVGRLDAEIRSLIDSVR